MIDERDVAAERSASRVRRSTRRCASIADHVALDSALAGSSSSADVMLGIVAVRAGSKNACADTVSAMTTYAIQMLIGAPHEQQTENQAAAHEVGGDHEAPAVHAVDDDAGQGTDERDRQQSATIIIQATAVADPVRSSSSA